MAKHRNRNLSKICRHSRKGWNDCGNSWWVNFKPPFGKSYRFSIDKQEQRHVQSREQAELLFAGYRLAILNGTFQLYPHKAPPNPAKPAKELLTLELLGQNYKKRKVTDAKRRAFDWMWIALVRIELEHPVRGKLAFGSWPCVDITSGVIAEFQHARAAAGCGPIGTNRLLSKLRAIFGWAIKTELIDATPFSRHGKAMVEFAPETPRKRRLRDADEELALLTAAQEFSNFYALLVGALTTGCREGGLLNLRWSAVNLAKNEITVYRSKTDTEDTLAIHPTLRAVLEMRRNGPDGQPLPVSAYVFGDECGRKLVFNTRAWSTVRLRAHGVEPQYDAQGNLDAPSRDALRKIGLHFHDLRREAGSRFLEAGVALHTVRDMLGHTNVAQTSTYLSSTLKSNHAAMARVAEHDARTGRLQPARCKLATIVENGVRSGPEVSTAPDKCPVIPGSGPFESVM